MNSTFQRELSRRGLLRGIGSLCGLGVGASALVGSGAARAETVIYQGEIPALLQFHNLNTGETSACDYCLNDSAAANQQKTFNYIMRDWRNNQMTQMDPNLLVMLSLIHSNLGSEKPINVISGYRSPATNEMLRSRSSGVAKNSYHTRGQAIDFSVRGVALHRLRDAARELKMGGVGYYPSSGFVHIDTGPVRTWG